MEQPQPVSSWAVGGRPQPEGLPAPVAIAELEHVYAFFRSRLGSRPDSEDLTQEVALRALPRLREGAVRAEVRTYLFRTAHSVLAEFWSRRLSHPIVELSDNAPSVTLSAPPAGPEVRVRFLLSGLREEHRRVLELRFLRGLSLREVAVEMGRTPGAIKQLQLRALRAAAARTP